MRIERLPPERWSELRTALVECQSNESLQLPKPENSVIVGAFDGDRLIGCIGAEKTWQVWPFWIDRKYRGNGLALSLAHEIEKSNIEGFAEMLITTNPHVDLMVFNLGFIPQRGTLWRRDER